MSPRVARPYILPVLASAAGCSMTLIAAAVQAAVVERTTATVTTVNDTITVAAAQSSTLSVLANDTLANAGTVSISAPASSDQGGTLTVAGTTIRYTPPAGLVEGDTDSFTYTVAEEDWRTAAQSGASGVVDADMSGLPSVFNDPDNGGDYVITDAPGYDGVDWTGVTWSSTTDDSGNLDTSSLYRYGVAPSFNSDITTCAAGSTAALSVTLDWSLTKIAGAAHGYEASISSLDSPKDTTAPYGNTIETAWDNGDTRTLSLTLSDLSADEANNLVFGLWAQDGQFEDVPEENDWTSNSVTLTYNLDTSSCTLVSASATVNLTIGEPADSDGDGLSDNNDLDDDNDGIPDSLESLNGSDLDSDSDGLVDRLDLDSDNDGLLDVQESGVANVADLDTDGDGRIDAAVGANGLADVAESSAESGSINYTLADSDGDGVSDFQDLDSDNDGVTDLMESGASASDANAAKSRLVGAVGADGLVDSLQSPVDASGYDFDGDGNLDTGPDTDGDGLADFRDTDADNDGLSDIFEAGGSDEQPAGGDGMVDDFVDTNGDGLDDALAVLPLETADTDGDGDPDFRDTDSDNDGRSDADEGLADEDGDGTPDYRQPNAEIQTGLSGGGCALGTGSPLDPTLPALALMSVLALLRRRR